MRVCKDIYTVVSERERKRKRGTERKTYREGQREKEPERARERKSQRGPERCRERKRHTQAQRGALTSGIVSETPSCMNKANSNATAAPIWYLAGVAFACGGQHSGDR